MYTNTLSHGSFKLKLEVLPAVTLTREICLVVYPVCNSIASESFHIPHRVKILHTNPCELNTVISMYIIQPIPIRLGLS